MKTYKELTEELYTIELDSLLEHEIIRLPDGRYKDDEGNVSYANPYKSSSTKSSTYIKRAYGRPVVKMQSALMNKDITKPKPTTKSKEDEVPHTVSIDGREWKTFQSQSHAFNVARKIQEKDPTKNVKVTPAR